MSNHLANTKPCRSPYCECPAGQCSSPGCHDARHETLEDHGYLHHGSAPGPFSTERVKVRLRGYPHAGMWEAYFEGRWRAVHVQLKRTYIVFQCERITIQIEGV